MRRRAWLVAPLLLAAACGSTAVDRLKEPDESVAREAIDDLVGRKALAEVLPLREHPDPLVKRRAKTVIGRLTGQWGSDGRIEWTRSASAAVNPDRPVLVLHLFGELDQEFC